MNKSLSYFIIISFLLMPSLCSGQELENDVIAALDGVEKMLDKKDDGKVKADDDDQHQDVKVKEKQLIREQISSLELIDQDTEGALNKIARMTGLSFIVSEPLPGKVTLSVDDITVWDLLKIILCEQGLAYYRTNGAVHIMKDSVFQERYGYNFPQPFPVKTVSVEYANLENLVPVLKVSKSPEGNIWIDSKNRQVMIIDSQEKLDELQSIIAQQDVPLVTEKITLEFIAYDEIKDNVQKMLTELVGHIDVDETGKKLVITDSQMKLQKIKEMIKLKDKQVLLPFRLKIIRIDLNEEHFEGVDWEAILADYRPYQMQMMFNNQPITEEISFGTVTEEDYDVLVDALDTVGNLSHLVSFNIDMVLNEEKNIGLETNDPFWSLRPGAREAQDGPVVLDPNGFEMQINLKTRREGEKVFVDMLPRLHWMREDEALDNMILIGVGRAQIELNEDEVIVIGSLIRTEEIARTRKIPLLGDLPMLGAVFRMERKNYRKIEYIIFLKPQAPFNVNTKVKK